MGILLSALGGAAGGLDAAMDQDRKLRDQQSMATFNSNLEQQRQQALALFASQAQAARDQAILGPVLGGGQPTPPSATLPVSSGGGGAPVASAGASDAGAQPSVGGTPVVAGPGKGGIGNAQVDFAQKMSAGVKALAEQYGIPEAAIRFDLAKNDGKGIAKMIEEAAKPDMVIQNNVAFDKKKLKPGFVPGVTTSADGKTIVNEVGEDGKPRVSIPAGAAEAFGTYRGIEAGVKAASTPMKVISKDGAEEYATEAQVLDAAKGGAKPPARPASAGEAAMREQVKGVDVNLQKEIADTQQAIANGSLNAKDKATAEEYLKVLQAQQTAGPAPAAAAPAAAAPAPSGRMQASLSTAQGASKEALGKLNESWVKTEYEPTRAAAESAGEMINSVKATRAAMQALGGTGWGTEARANGAAVLAGLGLAPERARIYAQNAQIFQNTALQRLQTTLNLAKGMQTEGDAERAAKTYASLGNTTKANEFILDLAEANAQRAQLKGQFYAAAMPAARQAGDLTEVDRKWNQFAPSIFSMPLMQRWGVK